MNETIIHFLQEQTCATVCCIGENGDPYCFSCYYAFNNDDPLLYFKSSAAAHHTSLLKTNSKVSGTILPDQMNKMITRGIQFQGEITDHADPMAGDATIKYHKKHPLALAMKGQVFTICINDIKMTDSKMGFGKKITWSRHEAGMAEMINN